MRFSILPCVGNKMSLRSPEVELSYLIAKKAGTLKNLWEVDPLVEFRFFNLIPNEFPYKGRKLHHMIVLKRQSERLRLWEIIELYCIKRKLDGTYDWFKKNCKSMRSVDNCYHEHCELVEEEYK